MTPKRARKYAAAIMLGFITSLFILSITAAYIALN